MNAASKELQRIPGVGKQVAQDLLDLGYTAVDQLAGEDPQAMYANLCALQGGRVDRCMLYVFRCAVYYAAKQDHADDALDEKLKWWNWKD